MPRKTTLELLREALDLAALDEKISPQERRVARARVEFFTVLAGRLIGGGVEEMAAAQDAICFVVAFLLLGVAPENEVERLNEIATKVLANKFLLREMLGIPHPAHEEGDVK